MKKTGKKFEIKIENMGVNIDKNEYSEIVLSNTNRPEAGLLGPKSSKNSIYKYFKTKKG